MKEPEPADQAESPISDLKPVGKASAELLDKIKQGFKSGTTRRLSSMGSSKWLNSLQKLMDDKGSKKLHENLLKRMNILKRKQSMVKDKTKGTLDGDLNKRVN